MSVTLILSSFFAGTLTILSPCVLPLVPFVVSSSLKQSKWGALSLSFGLILSFSTTTFFISRTGSLLGFTPEALKGASGIILLLSSLLFLFPKIIDWISLKLAPITGKLGKQKQPAGENVSGLAVLSGEFVNGLVLGPIWAPCSGPTLGVIMGLLVAQQSHAEALGLLGFFSIGALVPLLIASYGAKSTMNRIKSVSLRNSNLLKKSIGAFCMLMAIAILTGMDKKIEIALLQILPESWINLTISI